MEKKSQELSKMQEELKAESKLRVDREARYQEAEKKFESKEKDLMAKFSTLSLDALSKNSEEFLKLLEK